MSDDIDDRLEEFISSLNIIREQLEQTTHTASSSAVDNIKDPDGGADEESSSIALEEYLANRLQQIGEVAPEKREVKGSRTGNGWDANQVMEHVYKIEPVSVKRAVDVAFSSYRNLPERIAGAFGRRKEALRIAVEPMVDYVPIWKVKGFHECYYLRTNSYRVNVRDDVVGVEVEGKTRDLILERKHRRFIPAAIVERLQKLASFLSNESKYFVISDILELAAKKTESELAMTSGGAMLTADQESTLTSWRTKRVFDLAELKVRGARVRVIESKISKETILEKFRERVVHMPERFKQILTNRLEVSELKRIYVPLIRIGVQKGLVPREVVVNGVNGEIADDELVELLETG